MAPWVWSWIQTYEFDSLQGQGPLATSQFLFETARKGLCIHEIARHQEATWDVPKISADFPSKATQSLPVEWVALKPS